MYVSTYLELYTTIIGWKLYDLVFAYLSESGLFLYPFIALVGGFLTRSERYDEGDPRLGHLISAVISVFVMLFALVPLYTVQPTQILFQPSPTFQNLNPSDVSADNNESTFTSSFQNFNLSGAQAPLWWMFVYTGSSAAAHAIADNLPKNGDIKQLQLAISHENIEDPVLRAQYKGFYKNCYVAARNKYERYATQDKLPVEAITAFERYGAQDLNWPGSYIFSATPGLYAPCPTPRSCGSTLQSRQAVNAAGTRKSCGAWWQQLRVDLLLEVTGETLDNLRSYQRSKGQPWEAYETSLLKKKLQNFNRDNIVGNDSYGNRSWFGSAFDFVQNAASLPTVASQAFQRDTAMGIAKMAMPMIKAVLLLMFTFILPFLIVLGNYSIGSIITLTMIGFSLHFMHALFAVAAMVDHYLIEMVTDGIGWENYLANPVDLGGTRMLLDVVAGGLYVFAPAIWFYGMTFVGISGGLQMNQMFSSSSAGATSVANKGGAGGAGAIKQGATKAASAAKSRMGDQ